MTDAAKQALIDAAKTASPGDLVTWAELKTILEALKDDVALSDLSPTTGQVAKYNGSSWAAAAEGSVTTQLVASSTIQAISEPSFKRNDGQTIVEMANGTLLCAFQSFYGASTEDEGESRIYLKDSTDGGLTWTNGRVLITTVDSGRNVYVPSLQKRANGNIVCIFLGKSAGDPSAFYQMTSTDNGATWSGATNIYNSAVVYVQSGHNCIYIAKSGRWFYPFEENTNGIQGSGSGNYTGKLLYSDNEGSTWTLSGVTINGPDNFCAESSMYSVDSLFDQRPYLQQERIVRTFRTRSGRIYATHTDDNGSTFSAIYPLALDSNSSESCFLKHKDVVIGVQNRKYNSESGFADSRGTLEIVVSKNGGATWVRHLVIEGQDDNVYFGGSINLVGNNVLIAYNAWNDAITRCDLKLKIYPIALLSTASWSERQSSLNLNATINTLDTEPDEILRIGNESIIDQTDAFFTIGSTTGSQASFSPWIKSRSTSALPYGILQLVEVGNDAATYADSAGHSINVRKRDGAAVVNMPLFIVLNNGSAKFSVLPSGVMKITATNYADDAAAASGGVPVGGVYHTSGTLKVRLA